jgi:hypothetical protein
MGVLQLLELAAVGVSKGAELIAKGIELARQGDEDGALKLLDEALGNSDESTAAVRPLLIGVKERIAAQIAAKRKEFDTSDADAVPVPEIIE